MFLPDPFNNVRRLCSFVGDASSVDRRWKIRTYMTGYRYLLVNLDTGEFRAVPHSALTSLY